MPLHMASVAAEPRPLGRTVTDIGPGLVQMEVETQVPYASSNVLHWRLADGKKPPLDIALNADTGAFLRLVFFVWHELIPPGRRAAQGPAPRPGSVLFDLAPWPDGVYGDRYVDESGTAGMELVDDELIVSLTNAPVSHVVDCGVLRFHADAAGDLAAISLPALGASTIALLDGAGVLGP